MRLDTNDTTLRQLFLAALICIMIWISAARIARADAHYDWSALSGVERVAYINPFFPETLRSPSQMKNQNRQVIEHLQVLRLTLQKSIYKRLQQQKRFGMIPPTRVEAELHKLHWTAADLFVAQGKAPGKSWPIPNPERVAKLARLIGADAVILGEMRAPASIAEGPRLNHDLWNVNPLNISIKRVRAHVVSPRVQAFMVSQDGLVVWKDEQMADHPRTNPRTLRTLLLDWQEATAQVAQQLVDSILRLPPPGR